jgi:hypothetical protein
MVTVRDRESRELTANVAGADQSDRHCYPPPLHLSVASTFHDSTTER